MLFRSNPLTVITGPPGTGKSQVVTAILVNAARQGKTALFVSKNNKAVDVVETRVNALGPRPILLRLGANQYQAKLAEYLTSLLGATATQSDHERHRECEAIFASLQQRSGALDTEVQSLIRLRNEVDGLEQQVEQIRQTVSDDAFLRYRTLNHEDLKRTASDMTAAIRSADKAQQDFVTRWLWPFVRNSRFMQLAETARLFKDK